MIVNIVAQRGSLRNLRTSAARADECLWSAMPCLILCSDFFLVGTKSVYILGITSGPITITLLLHRLVQNMLRSSPRTDTVCIHSVFKVRSTISWMAYYRTAAQLVESNFIFMILGKKSPLGWDYRTSCVNPHWYYSLIFFKKTRIQNSWEIFGMFQI